MNCFRRSQENVLTWSWRELRRREQKIQKQARFLVFCLYNWCPASWNNLVPMGVGPEGKDWIVNELMGWELTVMVWTEEEYAGGGWQLSDGPSVWMR